MVSCDVSAGIQYDATLRSKKGLLYIFIAYYINIYYKISLERITRAIYTVFSYFIVIRSKRKNKINPKPSPRTKIRFPLESVSDRTAVVKPNRRRVQTSRGKNENFTRTGGDVSFNTLPWRVPYGGEATSISKTRLYETNNVNRHGQRRTFVCSKRLRD